MTTVVLNTDKKGNYYCDAVIKQEEWEDILEATDDGQNRQFDVLLMFYRKPGHKSTCKAIGKEYSLSYMAVRSLIVHFNQTAKRFVHNRFSIISEDDGKETFWPISMLGKQLTDNAFEWTVRPELCAALRKHLIKKMVRAYGNRIISEGLDNSVSKEKYKWKFLASCQGRDTAEILKILLTPSSNFIEKPHLGATMAKLLKSDPEGLSRVFDVLRQDKPLPEILAEFSAAAKAITPDGLSTFGDERTAAAFLSSIDPQRYTPYTSAMYREYCSYIGDISKNTGEKYEHLLSLLDEVKVYESQEKGLVGKLHEETDSLIWSELLNAQDILWQMQEYMKASRGGSWLQKMYNEAIASNNWVYKDWYPRTTYHRTARACSAMTNTERSSRTGQQYIPF